MKKVITFALCAFLLTVSYFVTQPLKRISAMQQNYTPLQHSLGSECALATNAAGVPAATTRVQNFISYRSGVSINSETVTKLNNFETSFQNGSFTGFTRAELKSVINQQWSDIFAAQNALYIAYMGNVWRVMPDGQNGIVQPRGGEPAIKRAEWDQFASDYKNNISGTDGGYARSQTPAKLNAQIDGALDIYGAAVSTWNTTTYSPTQAFLLGYGILLDEKLAGNSTDVAAQMANIQTYYTTKGLNVPTTGRHAYGVNGYCYTTPADILFSASVQNALLNKLIALRP